MKHFAEIIFDNNNVNSERIALVDQNGTRETSWKDLYIMAQKVAVYAKKKGIEGLVPVRMERCTETVAAYLGLSLSGAGIAPLAFDVPKERLKNIEEQSENKAFTKEDFDLAMKENAGDFVKTEGFTETAYVVFTSGSTGTPKGVVFNDDNLSKAIIRIAGPAFFDLRADDIVLKSTSFSFVSSISDLFAALYVGCVTHILPEEGRKDVNILKAYVEKHNITAVILVPQILKKYGTSPSLRIVITGSERVSDIGPSGFKLVTAYGQSESVAFAFPYTIEKAMKNTPIGLPHPDFEAFVVDENGNLCDEGELCLSGAVAHSYYNRPDLSEKVFTKNPYSDKKGHEVLLHTGDIVKKLPDGNYIFVNRKDYMIKISGQRVEPGEIEAVLKETKGIKEAVVKGFTEEDGRSFLCAFYVSDEKLDSEKIKAELSKSLPKYMIPAFFVSLDRMPLNENGKLNRKALLPPDVSKMQNEYEAPSNETEEKLCKAFEKILCLEKVGINDDFFNLGGDSIRSMEVIRQTGLENLNSTHIFNGRTPKKIAELVKGATKDVYADLEKGKTRAKLTDSQMGVYLECAKEPLSTMYNIAFLFSFERQEGITLDDIKKAVLKTALAHPAILSHFEESDEGIFMVRPEFDFLKNPDEISEESENALKEIEDKIITKTAEINDADLNGIKQDFIKVFDLKKGPLCRFEIYFTEKKVNVLFDIHHAVFDGTSVTILVKDILRAVFGEPVSAEKTEAFSLSEAEEIIAGTEQYKKAGEYFEKLLGGVEIDSSIVPDFKNKKGEKPEEEKEQHGIPYNYKYYSLDEITEKGLLNNKKITANTYFMTAFGYALAKMTGQEESLFCAAESGRKNPLLDNTVSMLVRTIPVVARFDEEKQSDEILTALQSQFHESMRNDIFSFGELVKEYGINSDIMFVYQSDMLTRASVDVKPKSGIEKVSAEMEFLENPNGLTNINAMVNKKDGRYILTIGYRTDYYSEKTIDRMAFIYKEAVDCMLKNGRLCDVSLVDEKELELLGSFNNEVMPYDIIETFLSQFKNSVAKYPEKQAVVFKEKSYTYAELDDITTRLAGYILSLGIGREQAVSVLIPRSEYMVITSIGILKAGAICEPLDPSYPEDRLSFMVEDAASKLLITTKELKDLLPEFKGTVLLIDDIPGLSDYKDALPIVKPEDTFILLYTSGTTGKPKGCMLSHKNLRAVINAEFKYRKLDSESRVSAYASFGFDAHIGEIYPTLAIGGTIFVIPNEIRLDLAAIKDFCETNGITNLFMTTQVARQFAVEFPEVKHLKVLLTGGEKLLSLNPPKNYTLVNAYGPTESIMYITAFEVDDYYDDIPIGKATVNTRLYITDKLGRRVPVGVPGELVVNGPQVGKGYLNREDKTKEAFVPNIYEETSDENYMNCYKTGDIVRYLEGGNIEFIGRRDLQVKIRGYRIELSEVEQVIREYPTITDATVIAVNVPGGKAIHAYIVSKEQVNISDLNKFIKSRKPAYMVPAATLQIESIPLNVNQKVDKRKLPPIVIESNGKEDGNRSLTKLEEDILAVIKDETGLSDFGVETELADAGVTSISSIKLAVVLYKKYGVNITSKDILDEGSVLSLENIIVEGLIKKTSETGSEKVKEKLKSYPLTQTQMGIYLDCLRAGMGAYNIPMLFKLSKDIDITKLKDAIRKTVKAHPSMLVGIFTDDKGDVFAYPRDEWDVEIFEETVEEIPAPATEFVFEDAPLFKFRILHYEDDIYFLAEIHHIIGDGESLTILIEDIDKAYSGKKLEEEKYTAFDASLDEQAKRNGKEIKSARDYYDSIFKGISADYLPNADRKEGPACVMAEYPVSIEKSKVKALAERLKISENVLFTGIFAMTIAKFTAHEDAYFTTVHNGRNDPRCERMVSMLVKTLPVFVSCEAEMAVADYFAEIDKRLKNLKKYDLFSFADAAREYGVNADTIFVYQGRMLSDITIGGKKAEQIHMENNTAKAELSFELFEDEDAYRIEVEYNGGRYSADFMESFADAYATCLESFTEKEKLGEIEITSEKALHKFDGFNDTYVDVPYKPAVCLFEEQVKDHPERLAVVASGEKLTYDELNHMANNLAYKLIGVGVKPDCPVAIIVGRRKEIYVSQMGILKSGGAFLCLSPEYPDERISFVCEDGSVKALVTTREIAEERKSLIDSLGIPVVYVDEVPADALDENPDIYVEADQLSYLIYTSGSTGKPKGVMLKQQGLLHVSHNHPKNDMVYNYQRLCPVVTAVTAFTFDASVVDGFISLANGCTVCIASDDEIHNPIAYAKLLKDNNVTGMLGTPSFFLSVVDVPEMAEPIKNLRAVVAGGEAFSTVLYEKLRKLNPNLVINNGYGPSEATICSTNKVLESADITIGTPMINCKIYIADRQNHVMPMGALGEMVVTGKLVGRGYINRDDLNKKSYIRFMGEPAFKTGDLSLITHEGEIEFHGRIDNQVKLRGLRVELGEIENAINTCPDVNSCIVTVHGDERNRFLAAYFTASRKIPAQEIKDEISKTLAVYMVPGVIMQLDEMPLTANGKIDKKALPEPEMQVETREYVAPSNETEKVLCEVFAEALGLERVGVDDDFFSLGGTSLTATKVAMFALSHNIPIVYADVFKYPTVRELAKIKGGEEAKEEKPEEDYTEINKVLETNRWNVGDYAGLNELGNVLLTGPTGFLGMHVLNNLIKNETGNIYCLMRKGESASLELKLLGMYIYYFDESIEDLIGSRIFCIEGDITDDGLPEKYADLPFDTVFNCAACVKHFSNDDTLERVNVHGVENLVKLCMKTGSRLVHVSTISIGGEGMDGKPADDKLIHENELFFGQILENQYIDTKFRAERIVLDAVSKGLDGKIMRAGNLMPRLSDGEFQINYLTNGFMRRLYGYSALGCIPYSGLAEELEFSPIDETAAAMICLAKSDRRFSVFHANNTHRVCMADVVRAMNYAGLKVEAVSEEEFGNRLGAALADEKVNQSVSGLIAYMNRNAPGSRYMIGYDNSFTRSVLNRMGFAWHITDEDYMKNAFEQLRDMGFFDLLEL